MHVHKQLVRTPGRTAELILRPVPCSSAPIASTSRRCGGSVACMSAKVGVVIVDHGSRKKESNEQLVVFGELYKQMTEADIVEIAHMEIAEPTIEQAIERCVGQGADQVVVAPYFLSRGRHIQEDIPELVNQAKLRFPDLKCVVADPIGIDPLMAQLIKNRVDSALALESKKS